MPAKRYIVCLTAEERQRLEQLTQKGIAAARKINHARILLKADVNHLDGGWTDQAISFRQKKPHTSKRSVSVG